MNSSDMTPSNNSSAQTVRHDVSILTDEDLYWFNEGTHFDLQSKLGARPHTAAGRRPRRLLRGLGA